MWWPAFDGIVVGVVGYFAPLTMGVGYTNIDNILGGSITGQALLTQLVLKFVSWSISLGSGTSGGTLAPLFTFGGAAGALVGGALATSLPALGMDPNMAALVGMAAMFAGTSQALRASVIFAFETTIQPFGLLPLLGGCTMAYLVARMMMDNSIMTERIARRGLPVSVDYSADMLVSILIRDAAASEVDCVRAEQTVAEARHWLGSHQRGNTHTGFPVLNGQQRIVGKVTRKDLAGDDIDPSTALRDLLNPPPVVVLEIATVREAIDLMVTEGVGRLPLVTSEKPGHVTGIVTRSDLLGIYGERLHASRRLKRTISLRSFLPGENARPPA